ncbi:Translation initiation factor IF-2, isoform beta [Buchnera aphidicola (Cinara piceae)]|uniref:Translation initiation factor IF-2 n=1 Tax=Buchnera aphidicola (Cinara piceae) TaxID=1660043 RepID=A0A803FU29_9GAMM|nr:translation initiation factor IF-2 [Buchnera aphidicola]VFP88444.1 Translation initiation factor IF-2, isoform beta [Buchnera aphidicola (Cinara piceae)]
MKLKKVKYNNNNPLPIKDKKKKIFNNKKKSINLVNSKFVTSDNSLQDRNKKNTNFIFKKNMKKKTSLFNSLNNKNTLKNKKIDSHILINENKKNIYNNRDSKQIKKNYIDNKLHRFSNINKNNKKNTIFSSNRSEKNFYNYKKKNTSHLIKNSILQQKFNKPSKIFNKPVIISNDISVLELSNKMSVKSSKVIQNLLNLGFSVSINQLLDKDTAQLVAEEMGHKVLFRPDNELEISLMKNRNSNNLIQETRPPIVTVMGHVDHGKTSLLDYIRSTKVVSKEFGGITQHIGAYHVNTPHGIITFLDTPGHAAFTAMRARGTKITDIVVLVVAADDGVMPQTIEAIQHAKNANIPIIVAINKIDKTKAYLEKIKKDLVKYSIISEEFGGENIFVLVSAKTGFGVDELLSVILLQSEMLELKSIYNGMASGVVIESFLDVKCGPIATVLIKEGTLHLNDIIVCGMEYGKVKLLRNELNSNVLLAGPSIPVEVLGLSGVPQTGDILTVVHDEKKARAVSIYRKTKFREKRLLNQKKTDIDNLFTKISTKKISDLNIILKADVQGSLEALLDSLQLLSDKIIKINIIMSSVGAITETDVYLSITTSSMLIGFNVRANSSAKKIIELENIEIRYYSIIYDLINDIKKIMSGLLIPTHKQKIIGLAEVRSIFKSPKFGLVSGCMVIEGVIKKTNPIRVLRNNIVIYEGELESLRRFKEDVIEVRNGIECGIGVKNYNDILIGDKIEVFQLFK